MSTRAQRRERAQTRRKADPVADRMAARDAIHAQYDAAVTAAREEASNTIRAARDTCDRKEDEAWTERERKMRELEERDLPPAEAELELERELEEHAGTSRILADIRSNVPTDTELGEDR